MIESMDRRDSALALIISFLAITALGLWAYVLFSDVQIKERHLEQVKLHIEENIPSGESYFFERTGAEENDKVDKGNFIVFVGDEKYVANFSLTNNDNVELVFFLKKENK